MPMPRPCSGLTNGPGSIPQSMVLLTSTVSLAPSFSSTLSNTLSDASANSEKPKVIRKIRVFVFIADD
ncbi:Uncharacterised protein [Vibrio cholerae]|nr:Uncharacterised protein [Vibrio cholerae]